MGSFVIIFAILILTLNHGTNVQGCGRSITTASGTYAPSHICSGQLIFEDNFNSLDTGKWKHANTLGGGGNGEFQWYTDASNNSVTEDGILKIKPTLTSDEIGEAALSSVTLDLRNKCTTDEFIGCKRTGTTQHILNPIRSARMDTSDSFSFKYGRVEVSAKAAAGDWLWPSIWMMPTSHFYGHWPTSGEINIMESRGNRNYELNGQSIGVQQMGSTLHWGPDPSDPSNDAYFRAHSERHNNSGFNSGFHTYEFVWTADSLSFKHDGQEIGRVTPSDGGFWELGNFGPGRKEWLDGTRLAPFDQEFYLILTLAVGGTSGYFPDEFVKPGGKPWSNRSPQAMTDFWNGRNQWLPTWNLGVNEDSFLQVDYVRVYAL